MYTPRFFLVKKNKLDWILIREMCGGRGTMNSIRSHCVWSQLAPKRGPSQQYQLVIPHQSLMSSQLSWYAQNWEADWGVRPQGYVEITVRSPMRCKTMKSRTQIRISLGSGGAERADKTWVHQKIIFLASAVISERFRRTLEPLRI